MDAAAMDEPRLSPAELRALVREARFLGVSLPHGALSKEHPGVDAKIYRLSERWREGAKAVLAIGTFDGVHTGHQYLIHQAKARAKALGLPLVVVTFDPDPATVLGGPKPASMILSSHDRLRGLASLSPDALVVFHFTRAFAALRFGEFFDQELFTLVKPSEIHVGAGFSLGRGGEGTPEVLSAFLAKRGCELCVHELLSEDGEVVSATRIRHLLNAGALEEAQRLLGRYPSLPGQVIHGRGEGASFGFPTANIAISAAYAFSRQGVYGGIAQDGAYAWPCAINLGEPPSFSPSRLPAEHFLAEASLIGFEGDLYGQILDLVILKHLRDSMTFESLSSLKATVLKNIHQVAAHLGNQAVEVA